CASRYWGCALSRLRFALLGLRPIALALRVIGAAPYRACASRYWGCALSRLRFALLGLRPIALALRVIGAAPYRACASRYWGCALSRLRFASFSTPRPSGPCKWPAAVMTAPAARRYESHVPQWYRA